MPDDRSDDPDRLPASPAPAMSRRAFFATAGLAVMAPSLPQAAESGGNRAGDGTPEQIHLTWGNDPSTSMIVSWSTPAQAVNPRVHFGPDVALGHVAHAVQRLYTDGINGQTCFCYHARLEGLAADAPVHYTVTADNDRRRDQPFAASFRTAPGGRARFRFTSYGDLSTPNPAWVLSSPQSVHAVAAVERFAPLFHLLNGDLCYADLNPTAQPAVWADFGNNNQVSASLRPWMPCPGNHEIEFNNGAEGLGAYLARYALPDNGTAFPGRWYRFRVGSVLFISLSADDVVYQDAGAFVAGPEPLRPAQSTGNPPIRPGTSLYIRGYSGGAQTAWLEATLAEASKDAGIDWIVVQMHQDALSSSKVGNGSDKGIRESWLPLFDRYGVDLVLCGHDHDYERSWPVRGCHHDTGSDAASGAVVDTLQPIPVVTSDPADGVFDTRQGTVHLILGGGGTSISCDGYLADAAGHPRAKVFTKSNRPVPGHAPPLPGAPPGDFLRHPADALEDAIWSARRDTGTGYGIGVFDVEPDDGQGKTSITLRYYHAPGADKGPAPNYELLESVVLAKPVRKTR